MKSKIKRTIAILLAVCFLVSITAAAASAGYNEKEKIVIEKQKTVVEKEKIVVEKEKKFRDDDENEEKFSFIGSDRLLLIAKFIYQMFNHSFSP